MKLSDLFGSKSPKLYVNDYVRVPGFERPVRVLDVNVSLGAVAVEALVSSEGMTPQFFTRVVPLADVQRVDADFKIKSGKPAIVVRNHGSKSVQKNPKLIQNRLRLV